jgi:hypothetical protein
MLEAAGIPRRANRPKLTGDRLTHAIALYSAGLSLSAVGEQLRVHSETVRRSLAKAGVRIRDRQGWDRTAALDRARNHATSAAPNVTGSM